MISYTNETKLKDLPEVDLKKEVEVLLKTILSDFGVIPQQDLFSHTVGRLSYLIGKKYKGYHLGEVKYVFEEMTEHMKGKVTVNAILQMFQLYDQKKVEKQMHDLEERELNYERTTMDLVRYPVGQAIIHKMNMYESGELTDENYFSVSLKKIAEDIASGKIKVTMPKKKTQHIWDI